MNLQKAQKIVKQEESFKATTQHIMGMSSADIYTLYHRWVDVLNPKKGKKGKDLQSNGPNQGQQ